MISYNPAPLSFNSNRIHLIIHQQNYFSLEGVEPIIKNKNTSVFIFLKTHVWSEFFVTQKALYKQIFVYGYKS